jgi:hypothetical protein
MPSVAPVDSVIFLQVERLTNNSYIEAGKKPFNISATGIED